MPNRSQRHKQEVHGGPPTSGGGGGGGIFPETLGAKLLVSLPVDKLAAGPVAAWVDSVIPAYNYVQANAAMQPVASQTSFGGKPGVTFDGVDDYLQLGAPVPSLPIGSVPVLLWSAITMPAHTPVDIEIVFSYGNGAARRELGVSGTAQGTANLGLVWFSGSYAVGASVASGKHAIMGKIMDNASQAFVDGAGGVADTINMISGVNTRSRIGGDSQSSGGVLRFFRGTTAGIWMTTADLTPAELSGMHAFMASLCA